MYGFARLGAIGAAGFLCATSAFAQVTYSVKEIPPLYDQAFATAMNASGQVTGYGASAATRTDHAFLFDGTQTFDLGTVGGLTSLGLAINSRGDVVGISSLPRSSSSVPFLWNGTMLPLALAGYSGGATAISDAGVVSGGLRDAANVEYAFRWFAGAFELSSAGFAPVGANQSATVIGNRQENGRLQGYVWSTTRFTRIASRLSDGATRAAAINAAGVVVGTDTNPQASRAFRWTASGGTKHLPDLGGASAVPLRINDAGHVVGYALDPQSQVHAVLWRGNTLVDLGLGRAVDVNANGTVIGEAPVEQAFVWQGTRRFLTEAIDPADPAKGSLRLRSAIAINEAGQILASGYDLRLEDPLVRSYVLTPVLWRFSGFLRPLVDPPAVNRRTAGASVPVKFALGGDRGLGIFAPGYPRVSCSCKPESQRKYVAAQLSGAGLKYDAASARYSFVWKTAKAWRGTCRVLELKFVDGQPVRSAVFRFE